MAKRFPGSGVISGLKATMPNGTDGPGYTLPALVVPMKGLTSAARSAACRAQGAVVRTSEAATSIERCTTNSQSGKDGPST